MSIYQYTVTDGMGNDKSLDAYQNHVVLIVNTACEWGLTPHFQGLEALYQAYKDRVFTVLAFPCNQFGGQDPGTNEEIQAFAQRTYHVHFPIMSKIEVNGPHESPLFSYLKEASGSGQIPWNFSKFLVDRTGTAVRFYEPQMAPEELKTDIEQLLNQ